MSRTARPTARRIPNREAIRSCICEHGPLLVATFRDQQVVELAREHSPYCPMPPAGLDITAYLARGIEVRL